MTDLYDQAISHYGIQNQLTQTMEECGELVKECSKLIRAMNGEFNYDPQGLAEEIADVQIMAGQLTRYFGIKDDVKRYRKAKLRRLAERVKNERNASESEVR